jgi:thymidylate synthase
LKAYLDIVRRVLDSGERKANRTGVDAITIAGAMFEHDMASGFPLLTTKRVPFGVVKTELEFFIRGLTDKRWLQERGCHIWDEWCNPEQVPYGTDEATKARMHEEPDLGPVYGFQWRHFGAEYISDIPLGFCGDGGVDQLAKLVYTLKTNPGDRRMIVSAWNPKDLGKQALPPCHWGFQVTVVNGRLNLLWNQRSVDTMLGLPFNIASYGLLLHLLAKDAGLVEGKLIGFLADTHVYVNHVEGAREQLAREPRTLPTISTPHDDEVPGGYTGNFSVFDWTREMSNVLGYEPHPKIEFPIAV